MEYTKKMSEFCETLIELTEDLRPGFNDTAILLCSDGKFLESRIVGDVFNIINLIRKKMESDDRFAEVILHVAAAYSIQLIHDNRGDGAKVLTMIEHEKEDTGNENS